MNDTKKAALRYLNTNKSVKAAKAIKKDYYKRNNDRQYAVRIWFTDEEAKEVRGFLETVREASTQTQSAEFLRKAILSAIRGV